MIFYLLSLFLIFYMFEVSEQQEQTIKKDQASDKNINLLPEDLKNKEMKELKRTLAQKNEKIRNTMTGGQVIKKEPVNFFGSLRNKLQGLFKNEFRTLNIKMPNKEDNKTPDKKLEKKPLIKTKLASEEKSVIEKNIGGLSERGKKIEDTGGNGLEVNLLPAIEGERMVKKKRMRGISVGVIIEAALLIVLGIGLLYWSNNTVDKANDLREEKDRLTLALRKSEADKANIAIFKKKLVDLEKILMGREQWSVFFKFLEDNTIPPVYYENLDFKDDGTVNLQAKAIDLTAVARQIVAFQDASDTVKQVYITGVDLVPEEETRGVEMEEGEETENFIGFSLQLVIDKSKLMAANNLSN